MPGRDALSISGTSSDDSHRSDCGKKTAMTIHASLRMRFAPNKLAEARKALCAMVERTRFSPGCVSCNIYQGLLDRNVLLFEEYWETQEDLERHLRSEQYRQMILVIEMAVEYPEIRFSEIARSTGMETIEKSRRDLRRLA